MRLLITGSSGFIGSYVAEEARARGHEVFPFDIKGSSRNDFRHFSAIKNACKKAKPEAVVIHLGALPSVQQSIKEPEVTYETNVRGTWNVLEAARLGGARRFVFASSAAVYGTTGEEYDGKPLSEDLPLQPKNPYGLAKKIGEQMVEMWSRDTLWKNIDGVSLRFFNVFGPRQRRDSAYATAIEKFLYQVAKKEPLTVVSPGTQRRDMVFVRDVARAVLAAAEAKKPLCGVAINIGSGANYSIQEIADIIGGKKYPRVMLPPRQGDVLEVLADISRAKTLLNWSPEVSFEEGIKIIKKCKQ
ncbi:MAG: UDP-glucose 4-epimerase [Parcubacteria group bacterium Gr01-1014_17]|nr:MAG: UDP-glucose 4-epimerase [Parcubacteria group bacterium Gr01-1014_17]